MRYRKISILLAMVLVFQSSAVVNAAEYTAGSTNVAFSEKINENTDSVEDDIEKSTGNGSVDDNNIEAAENTGEESSSIEKTEEKIVDTYNEENSSKAIQESYGQISWTIDDSGKLTVTGNGDVEKKDNWNFPWYEYREQITSAQISTTGMTDLSNFFNGCENLKTVDMSLLDTSEVTDMFGMFYDCYNLAEVDLSNFNTDKVTSMGCMFENSGLVKLDLNNFNTKNVTNMYRMFGGCRNLKELDLSGFNTDKVTDMSFMFDGCSELKSINMKGFNTENVTTMLAMFRDCRNLKELDLRNFRTCNVTNMAGMFQGCESLRNLEISNFNTEQTEDMSYMFQVCKELEMLDLDSFNTKSVDNMEGMFSGCKKLVEIKMSNFNTANVKNMVFMFSGCENLKNLNLKNFNTSNVEEMSAMFENCKSLSSIDLSAFNTNKVTYMSEMFLGCEQLGSLDLSNFNTEQTKGMELMFYNCKKLNELNLKSFNTQNVSWIGGMFYGCSELTSLDLSSFDLSNIQWGSSYGDEYYWDDQREKYSYPEYLVGGCTKLKVIKCPKYVTQKISLPVEENEVWRTEDELTITEFPRNNSNSVTITKNREIVSMVPENGDLNVGYSKGERYTPYFQITFDRTILGEKTDTNRNYANLDFTAGTMKIIRSSDEKVIYEVTQDDWMNELYHIEGTVSSDMVIKDEKSIRLDPLNAGNLFRKPGIEYYITVDKGFIQFADGTTNKAINKGEWTFRTGFVLSIPDSTWNFENYVGNQITDEDFEKLTLHFPPASKKAFAGFRKNAKRRGNCYGFSLTSILANAGLLSAENMDSNAEVLFDVEKNTKAQSVIEWSSMLQNLKTSVIDSSQFKRLGVKGQLEKIYNMKKPFILIYGYKGGKTPSGVKRKAGSHAVVGYYVESGSWTWHDGTYDTRVRIYDSNPGFDDEKCYLYFNYGTSDWEIPHEMYYYAGASSKKGGHLDRVCDDLSILNQCNYDELMKIAKTINKVELPDNWIRVEQGDIAVQTSNGMEYKPKEYIGVADENISVYYDADATFTDDTESTLNIIFKTLKDFAVIPNGEDTALELNALFENNYLEVSSIKYEKAYLNKEGAISLKGTEGIYDLSMTMNNSPISWETIDINGENGTEIAIKNVENGILVEGDDLNDLNVYGIKGQEKVKLNLSTDRKAVLLTEDENQKLVAKIDKDKDGTYETILGTENVVDKTELRNMLNEAEKMKEIEYTKESWEKFIKAKEEAEKVLKNENATKEGVTIASTELKKAMEMLIKVDNSDKNSVKNNSDKKINSGEKSLQKVNANTEDNSPIMGWTILGIISIGAIVIALIYKKKKDQ